MENYGRFVKSIDAYVGYLPVGSPDVVGCVANGNLTLDDHTK